DLCRHDLSLYPAWHRKASHAEDAMAAICALVRSARGGFPLSLRGEPSTDGILYLPRCPALFYRLTADDSVCKKCLRVEVLPHSSARPQRCAGAGDDRPCIRNVG